MMHIAISSSSSSSSLWSYPPIMTLSPHSSLDRQSYGCTLAVRTLPYMSHKLEWATVAYQNQTNQRWNLLSLSSSSSSSLLSSLFSISSSIDIRSPLTCFFHTASSPFRQAVPSKDLIPGPNSNKDARTDPNIEELKKKERKVEDMESQIKECKAEVEQIENKLKSMQPGPERDQMIAKLNYLQEEIKETRTQISLLLQIIAQLYGRIDKQRAESKAVVEKIVIGTPEQCKCLLVLHCFFSSSSCLDSLNILFGLFLSFPLFFSIILQS
jgi:hypothetical protein